MKGKFWRAFHLGGIVAWVVLIAPTLLWWKDSIVVVLLYSIYANLIGHFSAWQSARVETQADEHEEERVK